jgi:hypothetical protein
MQVVGAIISVAKLLDDAAAGVEGRDGGNFGHALFFV